LAQTALLIGNSDGIGRHTTQLLLAKGYTVVGMSRSALSLDHPNYRHHVQDVTEERYRQVLRDVLGSFAQLDLCVYSAGIGEPIRLDDLAFETKVFQVNLTGAVIATELAVGEMLRRRHGHFIGLSSIADVLVSPEAPSYSASKAGISRYWEGLGLALAGTGVKVSNIRFGFVDTKMAKSPVKPFLITPQAAASFILDVVERPRIRATKPIAMSWLASLSNVPARLRLLFR
jgi:NAD(P)-dependent dehydrogenase (short-subunit alcohol dehydrogenase family)